MKKVLESDARLKVDAFLDPIIALENFRPGLYDLLLIDIAMPKMNGFELYDKIRELDKKVKISFVTASEMFYEEIRKEPFLVEKGKTTGQKETGPNRTQFTYSANGMLNGNIQITDTGNYASVSKGNNLAFDLGYGVIATKEGTEMANYTLIEVDNVTPEGKLVFQGAAAYSTNSTGNYLF